MEQLRTLADVGDAGVSYARLAAGGRSVPDTPRFLFGDFTADLARRYAGEVMWRDVGLFAARDVELVGECLLYRRGLPLLCDGIDLHAGSRPALAARQAVVGSPRCLRDEAGDCVLLLGPGYRTYGHWLVDFLPKLFVLHAAGYALDAVRYLVPGDTPAFGLAWLDLLGIPVDRRIVYDPQYDVIRAETLLIPEQVRSNSRASPLFAAAAGFVGARIGPAQASPFGERVFISRARADRPTRTLGNRAAIEAMAAARGFAVVHPEALPLIEQVGLFRDARQIAGEYGSALHGSVFARPGTVVGALRGDGSPVAGFLQSAIGAALGQPTGYVFGRTDPDDRREGFIVDAAAFELCLDLVFGDLALA